MPLTTSASHLAVSQIRIRHAIAHSVAHWLLLSLYEGQEDADSI